MARGRRFAAVVSRSARRRRAAAFAVAPLVVVGTVFSSGLVLATPAAAADVATATAAAPATTTPPAAPAPVVTTPSVPSLPAIPQLAAADEPAAVLQAAQARQPVQVVGESSPKTLVTVDPAGVRTVTLSAGPTQALQNGTWARLDGTLHPVLGTVAPALTSTPMTLSAGAALPGPVASLTTPAGPVGLSWLAGLPAPSLAGNVATYPNVAPGLNLVVKAMPRGFELNAVLTTAPKTAPVLRIPLRLPGGNKLAPRDGGGFTVIDATGAPQAEISPTSMWDADHDPNKVGYDGEHPVATSVVTAADGSQELDLAPDPAFLTNPATKYPVTVDPQVVAPDNLDTDVTDYAPNSNYDSSTTLHVGRSGYGTTYRTFMSFDTHGLKGKDVSSGQLQMREHDSYTCAAKQMYTEGATPMRAGATTWNAQPTMDGHLWNSDSFDGGTQGSTTCPSGGNIFLNVTGLTQTWATNGYTSGPETVALRSANEADATQWKQFYSTETFLPPQIVVQAVAPPAAPSNLTPAAGTTGTTLTPTLGATAHQSDGNTARLDYQVFPYNTTTTAVASGSVSNVGNNAIGSWAVPAGKLSGNVRYSWRVRAFDGIGYGPWTALSDFTTAAVAPSAPTAVQATPGDTTATVTWTAPSVTGGSPNTGYTVTSNPGGLTATAPAGSTSAVVTGLTNGTSYTFTVVARNAAGTSPASAASNAVVPRPPSAPNITSTITGTGLAGSTATVGQTFSYATTLTNVDAQTVDVHDAAAVGDIATLGISVGGTTKPCTQVATSCIIDVTPGTKTPGLTITGLALPANAKVVLNYSGTVQRLSQTVCQALALTANVTTFGSSHMTVPASLAAPTDPNATPVASVCDYGLGLEPWWSFVSRPVGPNGVADVNAANGNLVVQQLDTTNVQARGRLSYTLRRTYNSQDSTVASLPGGLGTGWQLNFGEAGEGVGDGVSPSGLSVPPLATLLQPLSITLTDRDGTRHLFTAKTPGVPKTSLPPAVPAPTFNPRALQTLTSGNWQLSVGAAAGLVPDALDDTAKTAGAQTICIDTPYAAPAGVHLGLWRYIATNQTGCTNLSSQNSAVLGFATERPDRLRSEYDLTGRLLTQTDAAGVQLRYAYWGGVPNPVMTGGNQTLSLGPLSDVYESRSCSSTYNGLQPVVTGPSGVNCRSFHLGYGKDSSTAGNSTTLPTGPLTKVTDPANRTTQYSYNSDTVSGDVSNTPVVNVRRWLTKATNQDGSSETYAYAGVYPDGGGTAKTANCGAGSGDSASTGQLCSIVNTGDDGKTTAATGQLAAHNITSRGTTSFAYTGKGNDANHSHLVGLPHVATVTDRRLVATAFGYAPDGSSATSTDNPAGPVTEVRSFSKIDTSGRVGEITDGDPANHLAHDSQYLWDGDGTGRSNSLSCEQPSTTPRVDNALCYTGQLQVNAAGSRPSAATATTYNTDGYPLVQRRYDPKYTPGTNGARGTWDLKTPTGATFTTTSGYQVQSVNSDGSVTYDTDTPTGAGAVTSTGTDTNGNPSTTSNGGNRVDSATKRTVFSVDDHNATLPPRGNTVNPTGGYQAYETTWLVDAPTAGAGAGAGFNSWNGAAATYCSGTSGNTGLPCEQHTPAADSTSANCAGPSGSQYCWDVTKLGYDAYGARTSLTRPLGGTYHYTYYLDTDKDLSNSRSAGGWLKTVVDPKNKSVAYAYDIAGNRVRTWDRNATSSNSSNTNYSSLTTGPPGYTQTTYDPDSTYYTTSTDAHAVANPWRSVTASKDPLGNQTSLTVDSDGNITRLRTPRGNAAGVPDYDQNASYDPGDLLTSATKPLTAGSTATTQYTYDPFGNQTGVTNPDGHKTATDYDTANRPTAMRWTRGTYQATPTGQTPECAPDRQSTAADGVETGRRLCSSTTSYDDLDHTTSSTAPNGGGTTATYDTLGRATAQSVLRNTGNALWTKQNYDEDGNVTAACEPNAFDTNPTNTTPCNPADQTANASAMAASTTMGYNTADKITHKTTYRTSYDPASKTYTADKDHSTETTTYAYDADGNQNSTIDGSAVTTTGYDTLDRKTDVAVSRATPPPATDPTAAKTDPRYTNTTHYGYDAVGNQVLVAVDLPAGATTAAGALTATASAFDADNRQTDTVTGYTGDSTDTANPTGIHTGVTNAVSASNGGANNHTRTTYDADGNVTLSYSPRAFTSPATGTTPDSRFTVHVAYDLAGRPTSSATARYDTADPAFTDPTGAASGTQAAQCPTGQTGWAATVGVCTTQVTYDAAGNRTRVTLPTSNGSDGRYIGYDYTDDNQIAAVHAPGADAGLNGARKDAVTSYRYDGTGQVLTQVEPLPDANATPAAYTTTNAYNLDGTLTRTTPPSNSCGDQSTSYGYDNDGQKTSITLPDVFNHTTDCGSYTGDADRHGTKQTTASTAYLSDHHTASSTDPGGDTTSYTYDQWGNPASATAPNSKQPGTTASDYTTKYQYSQDHLLLAVDKPTHTTGTTPNHYKTVYSYDGAGRKTSADTGSATYSTDAAGTITSTITNDGGTQNFAWYANNKASGETGRDNTKHTSCYDADGNLLEAITGTTACASPDGRTLPTGLTSSADHLSRGYYLDDQPRTASDGTHPAGYAYDALGDPTARQLGTTTNPTGVGTSTYAYTDSEQLAKLTDTRATSAGGGTWTRIYDHDSRPGGGTLPNNNALSWSYSADGTISDQRQCTGVSVDTCQKNPGSSVVEEHAYAYDQQRRVLTDTISGSKTGTDTYQYTAAGRLDSWKDSTQPAGSQMKYANWDLNGNRTCWGTSCNGTPNTADSFTYNPDDSLGTWNVPSSGTNPGTHAVNYDNNGRRTSDGNACYSYNGYDNTTAIYAQTNNNCSGAPSAAANGSPGSPGVNYSYDPESRQNSQTGVGALSDVPDGTTTIGYDGDSARQTTETSGTGTTSWVLDDRNNPLADTTPAATKYLVNDGRGNITAETNSSGALTCLTRYDPFGNNRDNTTGTGTTAKAPAGSPCDQSVGTGDSTANGARTTANDLLYSSQRRDAHNNDYELGSRTYDPGNATFITPDADRNTVAERQPGVGTDPLTANTYNYVNGNPLNYSDPTGHTPCSSDCPAAETHPGGGSSGTPAREGSDDSRANSAAMQAREPANEGSAARNGDRNAGWDGVSPGSSKRQADVDRSQQTQAAAESLFKDLQQLYYVQFKVPRACQAGAYDKKACDKGETQQSALDQVVVLLGGLQGGEQPEDPAASREGLFSIGGFDPSQFEFPKAIDGKAPEDLSFEDQGLRDFKYDRHPVQRGEYASRPDLGVVDEQSYEARARVVVGGGDPGDEVASYRRQTGQQLYYNYSTNEFVSVKPNGGISTLFRPALRGSTNFDDVNYGAKYFQDQVLNDIRQRYTMPELE